MEATKGSALDSIRKRFTNPETGEWKEGAMDSIALAMRANAPTKTKIKPAWSSWKNQKAYEDVFELACEAFQSEIFNTPWEQERILELIEEHFENSLSLMPERTRKLALEHFSIYCSP